MKKSDKGQAGLALSVSGASIASVGLFVTILIPQNKWFGGILIGVGTILMAIGSKT